VLQASQQGRQRQPLSLVSNSCSADGVPLKHVAATLQCTTSDVDV
jgi:hypothetical protein